MPEQWEIVKISDKYDFTKKPRNLDYAQYKRIPFVPMDSIPQSGIYLKHYTTKPSSEISSGTYFEEGDLLVSKITPCFENGKQCIASKIENGFGIATTEVIPIKERKGISDKFFLFYYLLKGDVRSNIANKMEGATGRQRIPSRLLQNFLIPFPPLPQQKRIAKTLSTIQEAIETQDKIIGNLRELKKVVMEKVFTKGLDGEKTKQTEIGEMPEGWEIVELGHISKIESGGNAPQGDNFFKNGSLPFVRVQHFDETEQRVKKWDSITEKAVTEYKLKLFKKGTIVFPKSGASIHLEKRARLSVDSYVVSHLCCITPQSVNSDFLFYVLRNLKFATFAEGSSLPYLNLKNISQIKVALPSPPEQERIAETVQAIDRKIEYHENKKVTLQDFFKVALNGLMKGEN